MAFLLSILSVHPGPCRHFSSYHYGHLADCWDDDIPCLSCSRLVRTRHEYVLLTVRTRNLLLISCCIGPNVLVKLYVAYMKVLKDKEKTDIHEIRREHKSGIFRGLGILKTNSRFAAVMARLGVNTKDNMFATSLFAEMSAGDSDVRP